MCSCIYTYSIVKRAAEEVRKEQRFKSNSAVQNMKLSDCYIHGFLKRHNMRRKRVTGVRLTPIPLAL